MTDTLIEEFKGLTIWWQPEGHYVSFQVYLDDRGDELYLSGHVKWDGCTEINLVSTHFCGGQGLSVYLLLIQHLYTQAFNYMDSCQVDDPLAVSVVPK